MGNDSAPVDADATVLFDGQTLDWIENQWRGRGSGHEARWAAERLTTQQRERLIATQPDPVAAVAEDARRYAGAKVLFVREQAADDDDPLILH